LRRLVSMKHLLVLLILALGAAFAAYQPVAPQRGSYTYDLVLQKGSQQTYVGGRLLYDYIAGYVRMESWNTPEPNPGINGVTIWDMREAQPVVWTIDSLAQCWMQKLTDKMGIPSPDDYSKHKSLFDTLNHVSPLTLQF